MLKDTFSLYAAHLQYPVLQIDDFAIQYKKRINLPEILEVSCPSTVITLNIGWCLFRIYTVCLSSITTLDTSTVKMTFFIFYDKYGKELCPNT